MKTIDKETNSTIERRMGLYYIEDKSVVDSTGKPVKVYPNNIMKTGRMVVEVVNQRPAKMKQFDIPATVDIQKTMCRVESIESDEIPSVFESKLMADGALSVMYMGGKQYRVWYPDENENDYTVKYTISFSEAELKRAVEQAKEYRLGAEREYRISKQMHDDPHLESVDNDLKQDKESSDGFGLAYDCLTKVKNSIDKGLLKIVEGKRRWKQYTIDIHKLIWTRNRADGYEISVYINDTHIGDIENGKIEPTMDNFTFKKEQKKNK